VHAISEKVVKSLKKARLRPEKVFVYIGLKEIRPIRT
jgi:hypothetical protein